MAVDQRDDLTWIAVELSRYGENRVEDGEIEHLVRQDLGVQDDFPIFIPSATYRKNNRVITLHLMEGYLFVASGLPEVRYFALESKPYVSAIMSTVSGPYKMRTLSVLPNREIQGLQNQLREMVATDIEIGSIVIVSEGRFKKMEGTVLGPDGDNNAFVQMDLRSWSRIASIPRIFLEKQGSPKPGR